MNPPDPTDPLSRTLAAWRVQPPVDPQFRPAVWQRIERATRETWGGYLRAHVVRWSVAGALAVTAAGWAGHTAAQAKITADRDQIANSYLGALDPRVMAKLRP